MRPSGTQRSVGGRSQDVASLRPGLLPITPSGSGGKDSGLKQPLILRLRSAALRLTDYCDAFFSCRIDRS